MVEIRTFQTPADSASELDAFAALEVPREHSKSNKRTSARPSTHSLGVLRRIFLGAVVGCSEALPSRCPAQAVETKWSAKDGRICKNGQPIFPLGFYYIAHYPKDKPARLQDLERIADAGFEFIATPIDRQDRNFLDRCAALGVYVVLENNDPDQRALSRAIGTHPAFAWRATIDDVDQNGKDGRPRFTPEKAAAVNEEWRKLEGDRLTYMSGGSSEKLKGFMGRSGVIASQKYPIPVEPLGSVYNAYAHLVPAADEHKQQPLIANLQTFPWHGKQRMPTEVEVRNMTYQALVAGVDGILYYTYFDPVMNMSLERHSALWGEMRLLASEVTRVNNYLVGGDRAILKKGEGGVIAGQWTLNNKLLFVALNTRDKPAPISLTPEGAVHDSMVAAFPYRERSLDMVKGRITGTLPPGAVEVYELKVKAPRRKAGR